MKLFWVCFTLWYSVINVMAQSSGTIHYNWRLSSKAEYFQDADERVWGYLDSVAYRYNSNGQIDTMIKYSGVGQPIQSETITTYNPDGYITMSLQLDLNGRNNQLENYQITTRSYDSRNNIIEEIDENSWSDVYNRWWDGSKYFNTYDSNNNLITTLSQNLNASGSWSPDLLISFTYDSNHIILSSTQQYWDSTTGTWNNPIIRVLYANDNKGNHLSMTNQNAYYSDTLVNSTQALYAYDNRNNVISEIDQNWVSQRAWLDSSWSTSYFWQNTASIINNYDSLNNDTLQQFFNWNVGLQSWNRSREIVSSFVARNKLLSAIQLSWTDSIWYFNSRTDCAYDNKLNLLQEASTFNGTNPIFDSSFCYYYQYDVNNNKTYELLRTPKSDNDPRLIETHQAFFYYDSLLISDSVMGAQVFYAALFPNPSDGGNISLAFYTVESATIQISLYDVQGKLLTTSLRQISAGNNTIPLNYTSVSDGDYYIQLIDYATGKTGVFKFVKQ